MSLDVEAIRDRFPALTRRMGGRPVAYLDGPGGTQVPRDVIDAMAGYLERGGSNLGGGFAPSDESGAIVVSARLAVADLFAGSPDEVVFGANMTSLTFAVSRAVAGTWSEGDEVVVTRLDHDANITPWTRAAAERGAVVRWVDFDPADTTLDYEGLAAQLGPRTRLVAVTAASNAVGTIVDIPRVVEMAHAAGALVYVDAVHYAPHGLIDVAAWDCDFLVASPYKFFGPHAGVLFGKRRHLEELEAYRVRPAPAEPPGKWETGTKSFEALAGVAASVDYLASLAPPGEDDRRSRLAAALGAIGRHEEGLATRFLAGAAEIPGVRVYGITGEGRRTPTFAVEVDGLAPAEVARRLAEQAIFTWAGHYYAVAVMERLGVLEQGGLVRIGFVHYNERAEVDRVLQALAVMAGRKY